MPKPGKKRTFAERLYKLNKIPGAINKGLGPIDLVYKKLENPPDDGENKEKGLV